MPRQGLSLVSCLAAAALAGGCGGAAEQAVSLPRPATAVAVAPDFSGALWATTGGRPYVSLDGGWSWRPVPGAPGGTGVSFGSTGAVVVGPDGTQRGGYRGHRLTLPRAVRAPLVAVATPYYKTDRLYALDGRGRLWLSVLEGRSWQRLRAAGLPQTGRALAALRGPVTSPDTVYVAAGHDGLWRSRDFGATFRRVPGVAVADGVATTTADPRRLLVSGPRLLLSTDAGRSFRRVGPAGGAVAYDPRNWRIAFAASGRTLLRSDDGGAAWSAG